MLNNHAQLPHDTAIICALNESVLTGDRKQCLNGPSQSVGGLPMQPAMGFVPEVLTVQIALQKLPVDPEHPRQQSNAPMVAHLGCRW